WVHVGRRDPEHHRDAGPNLADHAAQELRGIRAILQGEVAERLVRERERLSSRAANAPRRLQVEQRRQRRRRDGGAREKTATGNLHATFLYRSVSRRGKSDANPCSGNTAREPARALGTCLRHQGHNVTAARYLLLGKSADQDSKVRLERAPAGS